MSNCKSFGRESRSLFCNVFGPQVEPRTALDPTSYAKIIARSWDVLSKDLTLKDSRHLT